MTVLMSWRGGVHSHRPGSELHKLNWLSFWLLVNKSIRLALELLYQFIGILLVDITLRLWSHLELARDY